MCDVIAPEGPLCAGQLYTFTTANCDDAVTVNWSLLLGPNGVADSEIFYSAQQNKTTLISVPVEGVYSFVIESCELA